MNKISRKKWGNDSSDDDDNNEEDHDERRFEIVSSKVKNSERYRVKTSASDSQEFEPTVKQNRPLCRFFVMSSSGCKNGENCRFLHERQLCAFYNTKNGCQRTSCPFAHSDDKSIPTTQKILKNCPRKGCTNMCLGRICKECHMQITNSDSEKRVSSKRNFNQHNV